MFESLLNVCVVTFMVLLENELVCRKLQKIITVTVVIFKMDDLCLTNTVYTDTDYSHETFMATDLMDFMDLFFNVFVYVMCVKVKLASSRTLNPEALPPGRTHIKRP